MLKNTYLVKNLNFQYMTIEIHPTLLNSWFCADIQREANASGVKIKSSPTICDTALVLWTRTIVPTLQNYDGLVSNLLYFVLYTYIVLCLILVDVIIVDSNPN